jgi:hypothetical protein
MQRAESVTRCDEIIDWRWISSGLSLSQANSKCIAAADVVLGSPINGDITMGSTGVDNSMVSIHNAFVQLLCLMPTEAERVSSALLEMCYWLAVS